MISLQPSSVSGSHAVTLLQGSAVPPWSFCSYVVLMSRYIPSSLSCVLSYLPPQLLLRVFIDSFQHRLSIHQYTRWGTFPVVSGTAFLSGCDPCPVLRLITLSFHFHRLECCSSLYTTSVCIVFMSQPRQGSDNPVSQDKISNNRH